MCRTARRLALALGVTFLLGAPPSLAAPPPAERPIPGRATAGPRTAPQPAGFRRLTDEAALEWCDGLDNDGDGSVDEERGTRFVAPGGSDADSLCLDSAVPCATIGRAIRAACAEETVQVGAGLYVEDLVIDRPLSLLRWGPPPNPELRGTGSGDVVSIRASRVTVGGIEISGAPGHACVRIGDPAHPDVRHARLENMGISGCAFGVVADSTGAPADTDTQNRIVSVHLHGMLADGRPGSGSGVLGLNGTGRLLVIGNLIDENEGAAVRVLAPPEGKQNDWILVVGNQLRGNGLAPGADSHAAVEVDQATRLRVEGNWIQGQVGAGAGSDGDGAVYRAVTGGEFACNRVEDNGVGVRLAGQTSGIAIVSNRFTANTVAAVAVEATAGGGSSVRENLFSGNAVAVENDRSATFDARHSWWGGAGGPASASDGVRGPVDVSGYIARGTAPLLVRRPMSSGWAPPVAACYDLLQDALAAAVPGDLVLVGEGTYLGHFALDRPIDLEGIAAPNACSPSVIDGTQSGGSHLPALALSGVSGVTLSNLTIRNAGAGTPCGANQGNEAGLSLADVRASSFTDLCLASNGVSELRLTGESDGNRLARLTIDGVLRDAFGQDACGHRSRDGVLVAGRAACEGGAAAIAESNAIEDAVIDGVSRGIAVRLARGTTVERVAIAPHAAPAWYGGGWAAGVHVDLAESDRAERPHDRRDGGVRGDPDRRPRGRRLRERDAGFGRNDGRPGDRDAGPRRGRPPLPRRDRPGRRRPERRCAAWTWRRTRSASRPTSSPSRRERRTGSSCRTSPETGWVSSTRRPSRYWRSGTGGRRSTAPRERGPAPATRRSARSSSGRFSARRRSTTTMGTASASAAATSTTPTRACARPRRLRRVRQRPRRLGGRGPVRRDLRRARQRLRRDGRRPSAAGRFGPGDAGPRRGAGAPHLVRARRGLGLRRRARRPGDAGGDPGRLRRRPERLPGRRRGDARGDRCRHGAEPLLPAAGGRLHERRDIRRASRRRPGSEPRRRDRGGRGTVSLSAGRTAPFLGIMGTGPRSVTMGKKDKCCDRYKKKDEYCRGCPIVDTCELAPRPPADGETGKKKDARKGKKDKKEKREKKGTKEKKGKKGKKDTKDKKDKKDKKSKKHRKAEQAGKAEQA